MIAPGPHPLIAARRALVATAAVLLMVVAAACDKVPLTAPTGSTLALFASTTVLPANGVADITATVTESAGTPVHNGTVVTFTTTLGAVDPAEARTTNGRVTVRFTSNGQSGVATVRAFSGAANSGTGSGTGSTTTTAEVQIRIGSAAASRIGLSATPGTLPVSGGTTTLSATVFDVNGNTLPGVAVGFSTDAGTLSQTTAMTDSGGVARVDLSTTRDAKVTATVGAAGTGTSGGGTTTSTVTADFTVRVSSAPSATITVTGTGTGGIIPVGSPATFTINVTNTGTNASPIRNVTLDFGDGTRQSLGALTGQATVAHVYNEPDIYTATVIVTTADGEVRSSTAVVVRPLDPFTVSLTASANQVAVQIPVAFTVTVPSGVTVTRVEWNFGDGASTVLNSTATTHVYGTPGTYTVTARVVASDGRTAVGQVQISIIP